MSPLRAADGRSETGPIGPSRSSRAKPAPSKEPRAYAEASSRWFSSVCGSCSAASSGTWNGARAEGCIMTGGQYLGAADRPVPSQRSNPQFCFLLARSAARIG